MQALLFNALLICLSEPNQKQELLLVIAEEGILGHHHDGLLLILLEDMGRNVLFVNNKTEHVFTEPAVGHDIAASLSDRLSP